MCFHKRSTSGAILALLSPEFNRTSDEISQGDCMTRAMMGHKFKEPVLEVADEVRICTRMLAEGHNTGASIDLVGPKV